MMELTKERLMALSNRENVGAICSDEIAEMARQLLAGLEQEPVAYMYKDRLHTDARFSLHTRFGNWSQEDINEYEITEIPLYAAPQLPQPAVAITQHFDTIALDTAKMVMCDVNRRDEFLGGDTQLLSRIQCRIDEACRAAMLQGAEPVSQPYTLPFEQWLSQQTGTIDVECGCVMTEVFYHWLRVAYEAGNSPVIQDGWVAVPVEPTEDMIIAGFEAGPYEDFSDPEEWEAYQSMSACRQAAHRAKLCWAAMIAAAPQQEVK